MRSRRNGDLIKFPTQAPKKEPTPEPTSKREEELKGLLAMQQRALQRRAELLEAGVTPFPQFAPPGAILTEEDSVFGEGAVIYTGVGLEAGEGFAPTLEELAEMYPARGFARPPVGKPIAARGQQEIILDDNSLARKLRRPMFAEPVVLYETTSLSWCSERHTQTFLRDLVGEKRVWLYTDPEALWFKEDDHWAKLTLFYGNVAALHHYIWTVIRETGDYHHVFAEVATLRGRISVGDRIYPVYEIFLGS